MDELISCNTRVFKLSAGKDFVILACVILTVCQRMMVRQTGGHPDRNTGLCIAISSVKMNGIFISATVCSNVGLEGDYCASKPQIMAKFIPS